jgi:integrase
VSERTPGIRKTSHGWQVYTTIGGRFRSKHFPPDTTPSELKQERSKLKAQATLGLAPEQPRDHDGPTLAEDVESYLKAIAGMTTVSDRTYRIKKWRDALGPDRDRSTVTAVEIRQQLEAWRVAGAKPGTLNLLHTALRHLYTVLDGPDAANPLRAIPRYREEELALSLPSWKTAKAVIDGIAPSKSRARLRVLMYTGWPSATLKRLRKADLAWRKKEALLHGRRKGGGTRPRVVPLLPDAVKALREFDKLNAYGPFSGSSLHSLLDRACKRAKVPPFRVYDLRHMFLSRVAARTHDERAVAELGLHSTPQQTWRYTRQAGSTRAKAALARLARF